MEILDLWLLCCLYITGHYYKFWFDLKSPFPQKFFFPATWSVAKWKYTRQKSFFWLQICELRFYYFRSNLFIMKKETKWCIQSVDGHAGPLFNTDGSVRGSWRALLVRRWNSDGGCQTPRENAIVPRINCDDDGKSYTHGLTFKQQATEDGGEHRNLSFFLFY